ncbi:RHS repeat-associated core domain-containing protein [Anaerostipes hadrus]|uniref:RHS repeat-associated core domain-containing protein n=1 Tax=Anaerostipes hadrus TaxID=649756 RepID=UPI001FA82EF3|nr:RHS repeat-associated core domain-containing protein [Anaerostipes hadrus]
MQGDDQAKNEVCYTGGIYDQSTGLYYLNARYYNPEDGRFMTEDSYRGEIMKPETGHLYMYCANNLVNYVDPRGHVPVRVVNAVAGALVGAATDVLQGAIVYTIIHKNLKKFKVSAKSVAYSMVSGGIDGLLFSSRWQKKATVLANSTKAGIKSFIDNRRRNVKSLIYNVFLDVSVTLAYNLIFCNDGIARKYWNKGLYHKGSYTYKSVTIKYGTTIKITSRSFKMTKEI